MRRLLAISTLVGLVTVGLTVPTAAEAATAKTFYVDCRATSSHGDGTSAKQAWSSLNAVNAHGPFQPGERVLLARGSSCKGALHPTGSGTARQPIVLGAYGKGAKPRIDGAGTRDHSAALEIRDSSYWTVQDLAITNWTGKRSSLTYRAGVRILNDSTRTMSGIVVQRLTVTKVSSTMRFTGADAREWGGIVAAAYGSAGFSGLRISANRIDHVGRTGIMVANHASRLATGVRVTGNYVTYTRGDGIVVRGVRDARIDYNRVGHASDQWPCAECSKISPLTANAAVWTANAKNVRIDHNEAWGTKVRGGDGEGFDIDTSATGVVLEYNYAHDNEGGGVLFCGSVSAVARFNIFENNAKSAFAFIGSLPTKKRTSIYNNTVYNSSRSAARIVRYFNGAHSAPISFKNNLLYNFDTGYDRYFWPTKKLSTAANTLIGLHGAGRPHDGRTSWRNPGLKNPGSGKTGRNTLKGYRPKHPSSFQRGVAIPSSVKVDFFGKRINPKKPPRGAAG